MEILSKARYTRTADEIATTAAYLERRIPFFQRFSSDQRLELCRVIDAISFWGKSLIFKQGSIGQAFYIILTGNVDIYVNSSDKQVPQKPSTDKSSVFDGLGEIVNVVGPGDVFGERALESKSSLCFCSIWSLTCNWKCRRHVLAHGFRRYAR